MQLDIECPAQLVSSHPMYCIEVTKVNTVLLRIYLGKSSAKKAKDGSSEYLNFKISRECMPPPPPRKKKNEKKKNLSPLALDMVTMWCAYLWKKKNGHASAGWACSSCVQSILRRWGECGGGLRSLWLVRSSDLVYDETIEAV